MSRKLVFCLLSIFIISIIFDWGVQLGYYFWKIWSDPTAFVGQKTLLDFRSGFVGDMVLLPILNCLIFYILYTLEISLKKLPIVRIGLFSLAGDFGMHYLQGALALTNWSMPEPFTWNGAGYWHMISLFFQLYIIFVFLYVLFAYRGEILESRRAKNTTVSIAAPLVTFLVIFVFDYRRLFGI